MANITRCYSGWSDVDLSPDGYKKGKEKYSIKENKEESR